MQQVAWVSRQLTGALALAVLALGVRLYYVHTAVVVDPIRGDAVQYLIYAINLLDHHVFSMQTQGTLLADGFRDPGYPSFLATLMAVAGRQQTFYLTVLNVQCALSACTVAMYSMLARRWIGTGAGIVVGLGMAFWPHAITLAGYLLSETLVGFLYALALVLLQAACDRRSALFGAASGLAFAAAALTNATLMPVVSLFGLIALWRDRDRRTIWAMMLGAALIPMTAWSIRDANLPSGASDGAGDRVAMNFVQGSWPEYHAAWSAAVIRREDAARAVLNAIDTEYDLLRKDRSAGLSSIFRRFSSEPLRYAIWYLSKPIELWGWEIGIGNGGIYVFPTRQSPLSGSGLLRLTTDLLFIVNPLLMVLACVGTIVVIATAQVRPAPLVLGAFTILLLTSIFMILQADARYAVPYRGIEWILAAAGWSWCAGATRKRAPDYLQTVSADTASR
jgi:hypothetical protein